MQTIDMHTHLVSCEVTFGRFYDRMAIRFFGKKMGFDTKALLAAPYLTYCSTLTQTIRRSKYLRKSVVFGVDARVNAKGEVLHRDLTVCASNEDVLRLYEAHSDVVIPFFSINPMRPDALDLIDRYSELGFKGAKFLQNYWNVNTNERRYRRYFEKLQEKNLPLIIHIGSESSVHSYRPCECISMLYHPLDAGVNVIAAHMALRYEPSKILRAFSGNAKYFNADYLTLLTMLQQHENLYADVSALLTPVRAKALRHLSEQYQIHDKLLFGTDYPVPFSTIVNSYDLPYRRRFELAKIENVFDRYVETMLEYFPKESALYSNYTKILDLS